VWNPKFHFEAHCSSCVCYLLEKLLLFVVVISSLTIHIHVAPEVALGKTASVAADMFSFASVVYYLTTGKQPYNVRDEFGLQQTFAGNYMPELQEQGTYSKLNGIMQSCWDKVPANRMTAKQVVDQVSQIIKDNKM